MTAVLRALLLMSVFVSPLGIAQDVDRTTSPDVAAGSVPGAPSLHEVIASVSSSTGKRFLLDPRVRANVGLVGLKARDVSYPVLLKILRVHGYSAYERDGVVVVVPDAFDRQTATPLVSADGLRASDDEVVTMIVPLKSISAGQLVPILRPLMPQSGHLAAAIDRNALVIVDRADNVRRIVEMARTLDRLPATTVPAPTSGEPKAK
jgi:general secretion pathway protein D